MSTQLLLTDKQHLHDDFFEGDYLDSYARNGKLP